MIGAHDTKLMLMNCGIRSAVISNLRRAQTGHGLVPGAEDSATTVGAQSPLQSDHLWWPCRFRSCTVTKLHLTGEWGERCPRHLMLAGFSTHVLFSYRERHLTVSLADLFALGECCDLAIAALTAHFGDPRVTTAHLDGAAAAAGTYNFGTKGSIFCERWQHSHGPSPACNAEVANAAAKHLAALPCVRHCADRRHV